MARTSQDAVHSYITDMLALEEHIDTALMAQVEDFESDHPSVGLALRGMHDTITRHVAALKGLEANRGTGPRLDIADFIKRAASTVAGMGAAAIDAVRTEKLPKSLRDDYTAFSLATIGYVMLLTTSRSLGDTRVGEVAERHLTDYARMVLQLNEMIPKAVVTLLKEEGLAINEGALVEVHAKVREAWRQDLERVG